MAAAPDPNVRRWLNRHFPDCAISSVTVLELYLGTALLPPGRRRDSLEQSAARVIRRFGSRVYSFDAVSAEAAARLFSVARSGGRGPHQLPAKLADLQIAGIAIAYRLAVATRDAADFAGLGLTLIDPWNAP